jgi:hypothetical protein
MRKLRGFPVLMNVLLWAGLAVTLILPWRAAGEVEQTFDVLQIGTHIYTNVTITTKAKNYIFLMHSTGLATIQVSEIPPELRETLGYRPPEQKPKSSASTAVHWAKDAMAYLSVSHVKATEKRWGESWSGHSAAEVAKIKAMGRREIYMAAGVLAAFHLIFCFFLKLICLKTGNEPGILIWLPVFQIFPLLRAAAMSPAWFLAYLVPASVASAANFWPTLFSQRMLPLFATLAVVNIIVAHGIWCAKIAKARGKSQWAGFCLFLPITGPLAFLYLALSNGSRAPKEDRRGSHIMTLEAA